MDPEQQNAEEIKRRAAAWDAQHRDSDMSYEDLRELLDGAVSAKFASGEEEYAYIRDFNDEWVVYSKKGEQYQCSYTVSGNEVSLGDPEPVRAVTTYEPVETKSARGAHHITVQHTKDGNTNVWVDSDADADGDAGDEKDSRKAEPHTSRNWATAKRKLFADDAIERPEARRVEVSLRSADDDSHIAHFIGYPSTTGVPYAVRDWLGEYTETITPGAFGKTLREAKEIPLLINHNLDGIPLASTAERDGRATLDLAEAERGLRSAAELDRRDAFTNSACVQLERRAIGKMSFSFNAIKEAWNDAYDDRAVNELALHEVSIVTWPANPTTSAELVEEMRSALGREGRSLWLAPDEMSVRSALSMSGRAGGADVDDLLERALRALAHADATVARAHGVHGRARTFVLAGAMMDLRAGKTLSAKNEGLVKQAVGALGAADKHHQKAAEALTSVLDSQASAEGDGTDNGTPPGNGDPILPQDGAGPRSIPPAVAQARQQVERMRRR